MKEKVYTRDIFQRDWIPLLTVKSGYWFDQWNLVNQMVESICALRMGVLTLSILNHPTSWVTSDIPTSDVHKIMAFAGIRVNPRMPGKSGYISSHWKNQSILLQQMNCIFQWIPRIQIRAECTSPTLSASITHEHLHPTLKNRLKIDERVKIRYIY